jgi:hypothetical protein
MQVWRTSCPRLPVWEDALDLGLVCREFRAGDGTTVTITKAGRALLEREGRIPTDRTASPTLVAAEG